MGLSLLSALLQQRQELVWGAFVFIHGRSGIQKGYLASTAFGGSEKEYHKKLSKVQIDSDQFLRYLSRHLSSRLVDAVSSRSALSGIATRKHSAISRVFEAV